MGLHNNVYIPKESWPDWIWYAIEFFIVLSASAVISNEIVHALNNSVNDQTIQNWIYWGIVGILFFIYYIVIRFLLLKRPVLQN